MRNEVGGYHDNSQQGCLFGLRYFVLDVLLVFISLWDWKMLSLKESLKMLLELVELAAQKHFPSPVELREVCFEGVPFTGEHRGPC